MPINYEAAKTLIKGLVQKMKSFRGNWNQNDPTADDYIKNRPFYTEQVEIVILPETTLNGEGNVNIKSPLIVGQEYKITWNGVVYRSIVRDYGGYRMIGNNAVYEWDDGIEDNTGEPFAAETNGDNLKLYFYMDDTVTEPPTVSITTFGESVHKIDSKYIDIPTNLATTDDVDSKMDATNPVGTGSFSMNRSDGTAVGDCSHAEGYWATASGYCSHAEGSNSSAYGTASHAEGNETIANGDYSHVEGDGTIADAWSTHAEGCRTIAKSAYSHAEGLETGARGFCSHTEGRGTEAYSEYQHVQGRYNNPDRNTDGWGKNKYAHIVGNGTSDTNRSNAHTLDWEGNAWFAGTVEGTAMILASPNGTKYKITVADDGTLTAAVTE